MLSFITLILHTSRCKLLLLDVSVNSKNNLCLMIYSLKKKIYTIRIKHQRSRLNIIYTLNPKSLY